MTLNIRIAVFIFAVLFVTSTHVSRAEEPKLARRIELKQQFDRSEDIRLMLMASTEGLLPGVHRDAIIAHRMVNYSPAVSPAYSIAGNVISALIIKAYNDNGNSNKVELKNRMVSVLKDVNITKQFEQRITESLQQAAFDRIAIEHPEDATDLEQPGLLARIGEKNILTVSVECFFDTDGRRFNSIADVYVWRTNETVPIYFSQLYYSSPTIASSIGIEPFDYWLKDNGQALLSQFPIAAQETARMLQMDLLSNSPYPLATTPKDTVWTNIATATRSNVPLFVLQSNQERLVGRPYAPETAILVSLPSDANATLQ